MVLNKKALKLVVCMSLIVALAISALSLSVGATFENTHYNSGDQAQDIVGVAQTQVGYYEGSNGYTKYGDWYGLPNSDWCAMFVSWCANQAGVDTNTFPSFALCSAGCDWFMSQGRFHYSGSYTPQAGDLIFYASYGNIYHVGLVTGSDGYNVYSIEGNYNEAVCNVSYSLSYGDILGYATPDYNTSSTDMPNYSDSTDSEDNYYDSTDSESLNDDYYYTDTDEDYAADENTDSEYIYDSDYEENSDTEESMDSDVTEDTDDGESTDITSDSELDTDDVTVTDTDSQTDTDSEVEDTDSEFYAQGDVNADGIINTIDVLTIQRYLISVEDLDDVQYLRADYDASGVVDLNDAVMILQIVAGYRV